MGMFYSKVESLKPPEDSCTSLGAFVFGEAILLTE